MADIEINEAIFKLRQEIEQIGETHPELKLRLETNLDELEDKLDASDDDNHLHLVADMKDALSQFEVEHPTITGVLNQLMVTLSNMGI
jgi:hypothetical protein